MQQRLSEFRETVQNVREMLRMGWEANPRVLVLVLAAQVAGGLLPVANAWILKQIVDLLVGSSVAITTESILPFLLPAAGLVILTILERALNAGNSQLQNELNRQLNYQTQLRLYQEVGRFDGVRLFESKQFHDILNLAQKGLSSGPQMMVYMTLSLVRGMVTLVSFVGVVALLNPVLALVLLAATLPQIWIRTQLGTKGFYWSSDWSTRQRIGYYLGSLLTSPNSATEVRLFNLKDYLLGRYNQTTQEMHLEERRKGWDEVRGGLIMAFIYGLTAGAALLLVIMQGLIRTVTPGAVALYLGALSNVQMWLFMIADIVGQLHEHSLMFGQFSKLRAIPNDIPSPENPQPVPVLQHGIELKNVTFRYDAEQTPVLNEVNLMIPAGKTVALVGLNGAGKTTLVKLLMRLYDPEQGQVLWDNIDLRDFDVKELREHTGTIFQDFMRYQLNVRDNIGLGNVAYIDDLERIQQVAKDSRIDEFIQKLPQGYDTVLSKWLAEDGQGTDLSGGQWQRIALARMYMRDADFLILDEPTAALDAEAEYEIYSHFARLLKDRTALLISHRFSTVRMADLIAVLEDGKITEFGTHQELMTANKTYARLYTMQADQYR